MGHLKPSVCIVTPGTREANNGNWRTAARWARMLQPRFRVILQTRWEGTECDALVALHARKSADSIAAFRARRPGGLAVVLTGTDLYKDLPGSREATQSLDAADRIAVLQDHAKGLLDPRWRRKTEVIFQSAATVQPRARSQERLEGAALGAQHPLTLRHVDAAGQPAVPLAQFQHRERRAAEPRLGRCRHDGFHPRSRRGSTGNRLQTLLANSGGAPGRA